MRVFWWQGGLHLEPETEVEAEAMLFLLNSVKYERPTDPREAPVSVADRGERLGQVERGLDLGTE